MVLETSTEKGIKIPYKKEALTFKVVNLNISCKTQQSKSEIKIQVIFLYLLLDLEKEINTVFALITTPETNRTTQYHHVIFLILISTK